MENLGPYAQIVRLSNGESFSVLNTHGLDRGQEILPEDREVGVPPLQGSRFDTHVYRLRGRSSRITGKAMVKFFRPNNTHTSNQDKTKNILMACARWKAFQESSPVQRNNIRIAEIIGISYNLPGNGFPAVITKHYQHGDILTFLGDGGELNSSLVGVFRKIARVVMFMHDIGLIHGHICAKNLLVDEDRSVLLGDPGMLTVATKSDGAVPKAWRYWPFSSEYVMDEPLRMTKEVDVHSFGMTMIEVYTRQLPYPDWPDAKFSRLMIHGLPEPQKPEVMPDRVWSIVQQCVKRDGRLNAKSLEQSLARLNA